jgi:hypothetical protein
VAVPTVVFDEYVAVGVADRPPAPVTLTVHGVRAEPVYVAEAGQVMVVVDVARAIVKVVEVDTGRWFESPA